MLLMDLINEIPCNNYLIDHTFKLSKGTCSTWDNKTLEQRMHDIYGQTQGVFDEEKRKQAETEFCVPDYDVGVHADQIDYIWFNMQTSMHWNVGLYPVGPGEKYDEMVPVIAAVQCENLLKAKWRRVAIGVRSDGLLNRINLMSELYKEMWRMSNGCAELRMKLSTLSDKLVV